MASLLHNLYIEQGTSFSKTFAFRWIVELICPASGTTESPITELEIDPLSEDLPSGYELIFACNKKLITTAVVLAGSSIVPVDPWIGSLKAGMQADGPEIDLSGQSFSGVIKRGFKGDQLASLIVVGTLGSLAVSLSDADTSLIASNIRREQLPVDQDPEAFLQNPGDLLQRGYVYQIEGFDGTSRNRVLEGRVFVSEEI